MLLPTGRCWVSSGRGQSRTRSGGRVALVGGCRVWGRFALAVSLRSSVATTRGGMARSAEFWPGGSRRAGGREVKRAVGTSEIGVIGRRRRRKVVRCAGDRCFHVTCWSTHVSAALPIRARLGTWTGAAVDTRGFDAWGVR